jgi:hypothetical protein
MKKCSICQQLKPETEFYKKGKSGRLNSLCKECFNDYCQKRWVDRKKLAVEYLGGKCSRCGYNGHYAALQFHHVRHKDFTWVKLRLFNWERVIQELDKCVLLCANCHAIIHSLES